MSEHTSENIIIIGSICRIYRRYIEAVHPVLSSSDDFKSRRQSERIFTYFGKKLLEINLRPEIISDLKQSLDTMDISGVDSDVDKLLSTIIYMFELFESSQREIFQKSAHQTIRVVTKSLFVNILKEFADIGLDVKSIEPGEDYEESDPELKFVSVKDNKKGDDKHLAGTVNSAITRHGYEYNGKIIKKQEIIINY